MAGKAASGWHENYIATVVSTTQLRLDRDTLWEKQLGFVAIDPFTTECEIRTITNIGASPNTDLITVSALLYTHAVGDKVIFFQGDSVPASWFGAKGDGSTDDTVALQAGLIQAQREDLWFDGEGDTFNVSMPLVMRPSQRFRRATLQPLATFAPVEGNSGVLVNQQDSAAIFTTSNVGGDLTFTVSGHALSNNTGIMFKAFPGLTLPSGVTAGKLYYARNVVGTPTFTYQIAIERNGTPLLWVSDGSGMHFGGVVALTKTTIQEINVTIPSGTVALALASTAGGASTTINEPVDGINTLEQTIPVVSTAGFPSWGLLKLDSNELVAYTSIDATNFLNCTRYRHRTSQSIGGVTQGFPHAHGAPVAECKERVNGMSLAVAQPSFLRDVRVDYFPGYGICLGGQDCDLQAIQTNRNHVNLAYEDMSFAFLDSWAPHDCIKDFYVPPAAEVRVFSTTGATICSFDGVHIETPTGATTSFDIAGSTSGLSIKNVSAKHFLANHIVVHIHTGAATTSGVQVENVWFTTSGSPATYVKDDDRGHTLLADSQTGIRRHGVRYDAPKLVASNEDGPIFIARPGGGYVRMGAQRPASPSFISRPDSAQTSDQGQWLDKSSNRHFAVNKDGRPVIKAVVTGSSEAPVTGDLAASEVVQWFDATNADPLVRFIGKNAAGTLFPDFTVRRKLFASKLWDPGSIALGAMATTTVTVTGAVVGDMAQASQTTLTQAGLVLTATVSAANTVTVTLFNAIGANPTVIAAGGTLRADVTKYA